MLKGVDISKYQGSANWDALKAAVDFVIFKVSAGCPDPGQSVSQYIDPQFSRNESESRRVGILRGGYHYAYPEYNDPEPEADQLFNAWGTPQENEVLALDFEETSNKDVVQWCLRFLDHLSGRLGGYKGVLYINLALANAHDWTPVVQAGYGLWLAEWDFNAAGAQPNTPWPFAAFRQYSDKENIAGLNPVDADVFYGDAAAFDRYGYHNPNAQPPVVTPPAVEETVAKAEYDAAVAHAADLQAKLDQLTSSDGAVQADDTLQKAAVAQLQERLALEGKVADEQFSRAEQLQAHLNQVLAQLAAITQPVPTPTFQLSGWVALFNKLFHKN